jgi:paraquat-inducible protein B
MTEGDFPVAEVTEANRPWWSGLSKMWLATLACLLVAIALTVHSLESPGPKIVIHFSEGHGLKPDDAVRHRGIEIGHVDSVQLNEQLDGVDVRVVLDTSAASIACKGSRFWIVRPELDFTGISGLETAVGAKYLGVIPGDSKVEQTEFDGLSRRPPGVLGRDGIEIILRGDDRFGVNPGSPLTWRGVEVGQILSSSLSADALHVDTRVQVLAAYRRLLSRNSKFWVTSGVHMGLNVTGFELETESFATIARGGIAFITPEPVDSADQVQPGDVFKLHDKRNNDWIDDATALNLMELQPPPMAMVIAAWKQKHFGITRTHEARSSAMTVATPSGFAVWLPTDMATPPPDAIEDSFQLEYRWEALASELQSAAGTDPSSPIAAVPLTLAGLSRAGLLASDRVRAPGSPEECFAVRKSWSSDNHSAVVIEMIWKHELTVAGRSWKATNENLRSEIWHGAAVIASKDEKVIGMLVVSDDGSVIAPLPPANSALESTRSAKQTL